MERMQKVVGTYKVNPNTMVILPKSTSEELCSFVKEVDDEFIVIQRPTEIIQHSCSFFGASYRGRVAGTRALIGITHKSPVAVSPTEKLFFFPTTSADHYECAWVSHRHVKKVHETPLKNVIVHFPNDFSVTLNTSIYSFEKQLYRTAQLKSAYLDREAFKQDSRQFEFVHENEIDEYIREKIKNNWL